MLELLSFQVVVFYLFLIVKLAVFVFVERILCCTSLFILILILIVVQLFTIQPNVILVFEFDILCYVNLL